MSDRTKKYIYIRQHLPESEILVQLAEKAARLSHAALTYRRTISRSSTTPTTKTEVDSYNELFEELGGVVCCLGSLGIHVHTNRNVWNNAEKELSNWVNRLESKEKERE